MYIVDYDIAYYILCVAYIYIYIYIYKGNADCQSSMCMLVVHDSLTCPRSLLKCISLFHHFGSYTIMDVMYKFVPFGA